MEYIGFVLFILLMHKLEKGVSGKAGKCVSDTNYIQRSKDEIGLRNMKDLTKLFNKEARETQ